MPLTNEELAKINPKDNAADKPDWDSYYVAMAYLVSVRSIDPSSKCGCVIVSKENRVLTTGYNGPLRGSVDEEIPLTRPDRYFHFIHSEENALLAYGGSYQDIQGATAYLTGPPCHVCLRMMLQKGIARIVYGDQSIKCVNDEDRRNREIMLWNRDVEFIVICNDKIMDVLNRAAFRVELNREGENNG